ncbi:hypothetical protein ACFQJD_09495 [Haloplanus sp. GCM10025708]|uniref:hypothetical protein n=1 Tax=Haloferacaceae TaxID=1644056 RepID=UPI00361C2AF8
MELTAALVAEKADEYERREPFYEVERERLATLPAAFDEGPMVWRDVEWVVRWYFRRNRRSRPDRRERVEAAFRDNDFDDLAAALDAVHDADTDRERLTRLEALAGVDVPVASAILQYAFPDRYVAVDARLWSVLRDADELDDSYPDPPSKADYERFVTICRTVADRLGVGLQTLYRALWRLGS